jgi:drug/metabolite transporter (DMT)-like permease
VHGHGGPAHLMGATSARLRLKTRVVAGVVIVSNVLGNSSMSWGLKSRATRLSYSPLDYLEALFNPWVALGVSLLILWMLSRMALLSWADLSYVLPITSLGYVLTAVMGRVFLLEQVSWQRWAGILLIVGGVSLVEYTPVRTTAARHDAREAA